MRSIAIAVLIVLIAAPGVLAQGMFLSEGQSGLGLSGHLGGGEDFDAAGVSLGFSTQGVFDFGLGYTRTRLDAGSSDRVEADEWAPFIAVGLVRPTPTTAFGAELRASYGFGKITNDNVFYRDVETSVITIGGAFYTPLRAADRFTVQPDFAVYYAALSAKPEGAASSSTESEIVLAVQLHGVIGRPSGTRIVVSPGFQSLDGEMAWTLALGFVFPQKNKKQSGWGSG